MAAPVLTNFEMTAALADVTAWLIQKGLGNEPVEDWLEVLCIKMVEAGIPLQRVNMATRAHHPEIGAVVFRWHSEDGKDVLTYERGDGPGEEYLASPIYHLLTSPIAELRQRLDEENPEKWYPIFDDLRARGATDYIALKRAFLHDQHHKEMDPTRPQEGMTISLTSAAEGGFTDAHLDAIRSILTPLCLTIKCYANRAMAQDITATYLGRDASLRVLSGDIRRGTTERVQAVIWLFDLDGFTKMSELYGGEAMIELLNDYFGEVVDVVEASGGNVLKFMGDGMLAIYDLNVVENAREVALEAASKLEALFAEIETRRRAEGLPVTGYSLGLHAGEVLYGNIGGKTRLDFTVIGSSVNTTARILGMSDPLDQRIVISAAVAEPLRDTRADLVSLGHYRLRGVTDRQELFTLD